MSENLISAIKDNYNTNRNRQITAYQSGTVDWPLPFEVTMMIFGYLRPLSAEELMKLSTICTVFRGAALDDFFWFPLCADKEFSRESDQPAYSIYLQNFKKRDFCLLTKTVPHYLKKPHKILEKFKKIHPVSEEKEELIYKTLVKARNKKAFYNEKKLLYAIAATTGVSSVLKLIYKKEGDINPITKKVYERVFRENTPTLPRLQQQIISFKNGENVWQEGWPLPQELTVQIFEYFRSNPEILARLSTVCKIFRLYALDNRFWKPLCIENGINTNNSSLHYVTYMKNIKERDYYLFTRVFLRYLPLSSYIKVLEEFEKQHPLSEKKQLIFKELSEIASRTHPSPDIRYTQNQILGSLAIMTGIPSLLHQLFSLTNSGSDIDSSIFSPKCLYTMSEESIFEAAVQNRNSDMVNLLLDLGGKPTVNDISSAIDNSDWKSVELFYQYISVEKNFDYVLHFLEILIAKDAATALIRNDINLLSEKKYRIYKSNINMSWILEKLCQKYPIDVIKEMLTFCQDINISDILIVYKKIKEINKDSLFSLFEKETIWNEVFKKVSSSLLAKDFDCPEALDVIKACREQEAIELIMFLLDRGDKIEENHINQALALGYADLIDILIKKAATEGYIFQPDQESLIATIRGQNIFLVQKIISMGVETEPAAFIAALRTGNSDVFHLLIQTGTEQNFNFLPTNDKALKAAIKGGNISLIKETISLRAKITQSDFNTALKTGNSEVFDCLIQLGKEQNIQFKPDLESAVFAIKGKNIALLQEVIKIGGGIKYQKKLLSEIPQLVTKEWPNINDRLQQRNEWHRKEWLMKNRRHYFKIMIKKGSAMGIFKGLPKGFIEAYIRDNREELRRYGVFPIADLDPKGNEKSGRKKKLVTPTIFKDKLQEQPEKRCLVS